MKPVCEMTLTEMCDSFRCTWLSDERVNEILREVERRKAARTDGPILISEKTDAMEGRR